MADLRALGSASNLVRFKLTNSTTGAGVTGLTFSSTGLIISTACDNESSATAYTSSGSTIETIATLGTFATPTATKCRFKEFDATNHPGLYEFQFADARFAVSNAKRMVVTVPAVSGLSLQQADYEIQLTGINVYDGVHGGMSALPNTAVTTNGSLITSGTGTDQLRLSSAGVDVQTIKTNPVVNAGTVTFPTNSTLASTANITTVAAVNSLAPPANWNLTVIDGSGGTTISNGTGTGQLQFSAGIVSANAKQIAGVTASASSGVSFPQTIASPTNITSASGITLAAVTHTGAIIPTVTNLTNAPTAGDFTSTMKTSLNAATPASVVGAVGSVTGNVGGVSGVTFPGTVASPTNITAGTITNVSDLTIRRNTAQTGASTSITLDSGASASNSFYNNCIVVITGGTGAGQARFITAYVGSTKVATVATWVTNPSSSSTFAILPFDAIAGASAPTAAQVATAVWTDLTSGTDFQTAGSIGEFVLALSGGSGGLNAITIHVVDSTPNPIQNAVVNIYNGGILIASGFTDASGNLIGTASNGTFTALVTASGFQNSNTSITVSGPGTFTIVLTAVAPISPPGDPEICTLAGYLLNTEGLPAVGVIVKAVPYARATVTSPVVTNTGSVFSFTPVESVSNSIGYVTMNLTKTSVLSLPVEYAITASDGQINRSGIRLTTNTLNIAML